MFKLNYENSKGQVVEFYARPYRLTSFTGLGDTETEIQSQKTPFKDGAVYIDSLLNDKQLEIGLVIDASGQEDLNAKRRYLSSVLNPKLGMGTLRYISGADIKEISVVPESLPYFPDGSSNRKSFFQRSTISLRALNPYWRDPNQTSVPLVAYTGNFKLPFRLPFKLGMSGDYTSLFNSGDMPSAVRIDIQGPVSNPQIINRTNGDWMRINRSIAENEILHIDCTPGRKRVEIYRGGSVFNVFGSLDPDSDWLTLEVGHNRIEHIADAGDLSSLVAITWNNEYVGI